MQHWQTDKATYEPSTYSPMQTEEVVQAARFPSPQEAVLSSLAREAAHNAEMAPEATYAIWPAQGTVQAALPAPEAKLVARLARED